MNLLQKLKARYALVNELSKPPVPEVEAEPEPIVSKLSKPVIHGGVQKTRSAEYTPNNHRHGGRIVKVMPRQLKQIKEAQERVEDDTDM
jgi:hypothetical protein